MRRPPETGAREDAGALRPLLELRGISKAFPGVKALDQVSLDVHAGEVHMVLGQNGAGKSSLMKVLCGAYTPDEGEIRINGDSIRMASPIDARLRGIAIIHQEFSLVPHLDIAQNIFLGRQPTRRPFGTIDHRRMHADAARLLETIGCRVDTREPVHRLGIAQQQLVEIAKALSQTPRVLVMDEPTAALSASEVEKLFAVVRGLRADGVAIIYISHRMSEIFRLGDRITVLRDGKRVASMRPSETTPDALVKSMVGKIVDARYRTRFCATPGAPVLSVAGLHSTNGTVDASLVVHAGEVVGLSGLVGSGRTELVRAIFGADAATRGDVTLFGARYRPDPARAVRRGLALVPENRKIEGLALQQSVTANLLASGLRNVFPRRWFDAAVARRSAETLTVRMGVATADVSQEVRSLSGGNQQKVVIGKWLCAQSRCFIFDEPTRGIDIGAKADIFALMEQLVADGSAVLMISSELSEVAAVCDRTYVMREGRIVGQLGRDALTEENILRLAMQEHVEHAA